MTREKIKPFYYKDLMGGAIINSKICDKIINYYKKNKHLAQEGIINYGNKSNIIDKKIKESKEIIFDYKKFFSLFPEYGKVLNEAFSHYKRKYPFVNENYWFNIQGSIKIQHYKKNQGFKTWHAENRGVGDGAKRVLVFLTYLNDVKDGGTIFHHQDVTTPAKKGLTLIWPAGWTHIHKGQISKTKEKYIVTGWYYFLT